MLIRRITQIAIFLALPLLGFGQSRTMFAGGEISNDSIVRGNILFEEFTGVWCGWCPRGHGILKEILDLHDNVIPVAIHGGEKEEPMRTLDGDQLILDLDTWFPTASVDRFKFPGQEIILNADSDWHRRVEERLLSPRLAEVSMEKTFDSQTGELELTVIIDFKKGAKGDFRFNAYIVEDNLIYDQENNLNENEDYPDLYGKGDPITGYVHDHVLRKMLGGPYGFNPDNGSGIPESVRGGERYSYTFNTIISSNYKLADIQLIAYVLDYDGPHGKEVLNAATIPLLVTSVDKIFQRDLVRVYPNPSKGDFNLIYDSEIPEKLDVIVSNIHGRTVYRETWNKPAGKHFMKLRLSDLPSAVYLLELSNGERLNYKRLMVMK